MTSRHSGFWHAVWILGILFAGGIIALYSWMPTDGSTGDMSSFTPQGFVVHWIIEDRPEGLQKNDIIIRAEGQTIEEWLDVAQPDPIQEAGQTIHYEILRNGKPLDLEIPLIPLTFLSILKHWWYQLLGALTYLLIGMFVFFNKPQQLDARVFLLFCVSLTLQYLGDAYNFQYAAILWQWPFWIHFSFEFVVYTISVATACYFTLIYPAKHPLIERSPRLIPFVLYFIPLLLIFLAVQLSPTRQLGLTLANTISWSTAIIQILLAISFGIRSGIKARDPVTRAQVRWILMSATIGVALIIPSYILPLITGARPYVHHPIVMILIVYMAVVFGFTILRFRLFDIDIIINRTIVYTTLTAMLVAIYFFIVSALTYLIQLTIQRENDTLVVFVATLSIASIFVPLRRRTQEIIDRVFFRVKVNFQQLSNELSQKIATSILPVQLVDLLTKQLPDQLQIKSASLAILDANGSHFINFNDREHDLFPISHPVPKYLQRHKKPILRLQPPREIPKDAIQYFDSQGIELCIPLILNANLVGLFNLGCKLSGDLYNRDELRLLNQIGRQAAVAVENSRLIQLKEHQAKKLTSLHEAAVSISSSLEIDQVLHNLVEKLGQVLDISNAYICDLDLITSSGKVLAEWISPHAANQTSDIGTECHLWEYPEIFAALKDGHTFSYYSHKHDQMFTNDHFISKYAIKTLFVVPLIIREQLIGFMELWETRFDREFTEADIRLCQTIAADAAAAMERARLFQAERKQRLLAEALQEAATIVGSTLDFETVLDQIFEQVEKVIDGDTYNIMLLEGNVAKVIRGHKYDDDAKVRTIMEYILEIDEFQTLKYMATTENALVIADTETNSLWTHREDWQQPKSYVGAPICLGHIVAGFLNVNGDTVNQFSEDDAKWLEAFAHHAATAISNANLFERIKVSLDEKEILLKEIHHRVKNNLQIINSLLSLQSAQMEDSQVGSIFLDTQNRVRSMALIHDKLYQSNNFSQINFAEYIEDLVAFIHHAYQVDAASIQIKINAEKIYLDIDAAIPCGMILSELISNALKHGFPAKRRGEVLIELCSGDQNRITISVSDNGIGIPSNIDLDNLESLGLQLVSTLVGQLHGEIELNRSKGTVFSISFLHD